jgi:uncharacterized protein with GYD domain
MKTAYDALQLRQRPLEQPIPEDQLEGSDSMASYIMLSTLTDEGRKTVKQNPKRIKEVNKEIEAMGAKVLAQYAVLGPYDFVNVIEAKDNNAIAKISVDLGSRGTVQFLTLPAIDIDQFIANLK